MLTQLVRVGTLTLVGLCVAATGCMVDDGDRPQDWTLPGDVRDGGARDSLGVDGGRDTKDVRDGDDVDADDGRDAGELLDASDTRDTTDLPPLDCTCAVEGATCEHVERENLRIDDRRAVCVHEETDCSEGGCPHGFVCREDRCVCDPDVYGAECRPACTDHVDCGEAQYCNVNDRCYPRRECDDDHHALCPPGYWCDPDLDVPGTCRRSGEMPIGGSCEKDWECESGSCCESGADCNEGTCLRRCLAEEDCPNRGRACSSFSDAYASLGCYEKTEGYSDCTVSCPEDQLCNGNECLPHACHRTAQCPEGDCVLSPKGLEYEKLGQCTGQERLCNGWEFRIDDDDPFCRLAIECENRYDPEYFACPEGYECVRGEDERLATSWCSRRVTDGPWP